MWCGVVWCGVVWYGMVWCGVVFGLVWCGLTTNFHIHISIVVWCGVVWCGVVWRGVAWRGMAWHGMAWHGMAWHGMACYIDIRCLLSLITCLSGYVFINVYYYISKNVQIVIDVASFISLLTFRFRFI